MSAPLHLAAIDTGSNAIRVSLAAASAAGQIEPIASERVPVRLGHGTFTSGELDARSIEDAVAAFSRFRRLFDQHGVERYRAVATSALRNATNREMLIDRLYRELGIELEVIDGKEEGRLVRKAVLHKLQGKSQPALILDLGGGSLEVMGLLQDHWNTASMKIGTVRLLDTFGLDGKISADEERMIQRFVTSQLRASLGDNTLQEHPDTAIACGGNAEALASLFGDTDKLGVKYLKTSELKRNLPKILEASVRERMTRFRVRRDRAEVMGVAGIVFNSVIDLLGLKKLQMPGVGIREGILLDLSESALGDLKSVDDKTGLASARAFAARMGHNLAHGEQVRRIASQLFQQLKSVHGLGGKAHKVLQLAALLHDLGEVVHRRSHHKHSEYLILNGRIPGISSPEREMVAALARAHRKSAPTEGKHTAFSVLDKSQQESVKKLSAILRIADALDGDHRHRIVAVNANDDGKETKIQLSIERSAHPVAPPKVSKSKLYEELFARKLSLEISEVSPKFQRRALRSE